MVENELKKKKRRPYRTKKFWEGFDSKINEQFPVGSRVKWRAYSGKVSSGTIASVCVRGRLDVLNLVTGKEYTIPADDLIPPDTKSADEIKALIVKLLDHGSRPTQVPVTPIAEPDPSRQFHPARIMPLSADEMIAHTALSAITKTLDRIRSNADSFRDPRLMDLVLNARNNLKVCLDELESYDEYPADA